MFVSDGHWRRSKDDPTGKIFPSMETITAHYFDRTDAIIKALAETDGDMAKAVEYLQKKSLAAVGKRPELREPEEAAVALDGVDGAKDARQPVRDSRRRLECEQTLDELDQQARPRPREERKG